MSDNWICIRYICNPHFYLIVLESLEYVALLESNLKFKIILINFKQILLKAEAKLCLDLKKKSLHMHKLG